MSADKIFDKEQVRVLARKLVDRLMEEVDSKVPNHDFIEKEAKQFSAIVSLDKLKEEEQTDLWAKVKELTDDDDA